MKLPVNPDEDKKKPMTDEERIALCRKLDEELDDLICGFKKSKYTEGWTEDNWQEEMENHPFFMRSTGENGELSPLAEGLANLKYDPAENTPLELATSYKEDGNFNFKHRNYRLAVLAYTEGIKIKVDDSEFNASLYNNRGAAQRMLANNRSALLDTEKALSFKPDHIKARMRAAKVSFELNKFDVCINHCKVLLERFPNNLEIVMLYNMAKNKKLIHDRDERKKNRVESRKKQERAAVIQAIIDRKLKIGFCDDLEDLEMSMLEPCMPGETDATVFLDNGVLKWPVVMLYPEYQITDLLKECPENVPLLRHLQQLFPAPWDKKKKYYIGNISIYFEGTDVKPYLVDPKRTLGEVLAMKHYEIKSGTPAFMIVPCGSRTERNYLHKYKC